MGDFNKDIQRREGNTPYDPIYSHSVEKDKKGREGFSELKTPTRAQILATLVSLFRKLLPSLYKGKSYASIEDLHQLLMHVLSFRQHLAILAIEDRSHQPEFTHQLAELWHNLVEDCNSMPSVEGESDESVDQVKFFLSQVNNFPLGSDHTLGYYFDGSAGKEWTPFPFMELLQGLHLEYQASPAISVLQGWLNLLDEILHTAGIQF